MDLYTLTIVHGIVYFMIASFMMTFYLLNRSVSGPFFWSLSTLISFGGFIATSLLDSSLGTFINNCGTLIGILLLLEGVLRFRQLGNTGKRLPLLLIYIFFSIGISYINKENPTARYLFHDVLIVLVSILIVSALLYRVKERSLPVHLFAAIPFGLVAVLFSYRWVLAFSGEFETNLVGSTLHPFQSVLYLLVIPYNIGWGFGFGALILFSYSEQLRQLSLQDDLTHLTNRRGLEVWFSSIFLSKLKPTGKTFTIGLFDVNGFKSINDTFGHAMGDHVIRHIAATLKTHQTDECFAVRLGGDEFVIVLSGESHEQLRAMAKGITGAVQHPFELEKYKIEIQVSLGFADYPDNGECIDELLHRADIEMYEEKSTTAISTRIESISS